MPSNIKDLDWQRIMEAGASGFGSSLAEGLIKVMFPDGNRTEQNRYWDKLLMRYVIG
ncbi:hypothetical protein [Bacillus thuringiensis]|uniref:hypothetical protein n=1 Tax=Bacillus thuringiensis TaxID=1428 RepID=UPI0015970B5D|nr:hypothetical protein [Bacillus thuringiensis]